MMKRSSLLPVPTAAGFLLLVSSAFAQGPAWYREVDGPQQAQDQASWLVPGPQGSAFVTSLSAGDAVVQRYDASGALVWSQTFDSGAYDYAFGITFDRAHGALYATGRAEDLHWFVWRFDPATGAVLWQRTYAGSSGLGGRPGFPAIDSAGGVVVGGWVRIGTSSTDIAAVRFAPDGTQSWEWTLATPENDTIGGFQALPSGGVRFSTSSGSTSTLRELDASGVEVSTRDITGTEWLIVDSGGNFMFGEEVGGQPRVTKVDPQGNTLWSTPIFSPGAEVRALERTTQDGVVLVDRAARLVRLDTNGTVLWSSSLPSPEKTWLGGEPASLELAPNGDIVLLLQRPFSSELFDNSLVVLRWAGDGTFLWGERLRGLGGISLYPARAIDGVDGGIVVLGTVLSVTLPASERDLALASVQPQSRAFCFADGGAGPCPCNQAAAPDGHGCYGTAAGQLVAEGVASLSGDALRLVARGSSGGDLGLTVLVQASSSTAAGTPFQSGLSCMGGSLVRIATVAAGQAGSVVDLPSGAQTISARAALAGDPIAPGSTRTYQAFFRGVAAGPCPGTHGSLTNAVEVLWRP